MPKAFDGVKIVNYNKNMFFNIEQSMYDFMRAYHKKGDTLAVARESGRMNFPQFFREVDRVAAGLYKLGVRKGSVVMLALPNIIQSVVATYAVSRLGAIASMIHPLLSGDEYESAVKKQSPKIVFLSDVNLKTFWGRCHGAKRIVCPYLGYGYLGLPRAKDFEAYQGDGSDPALYMRSGGTFGAPKTVVLSSRAANAMAGNLLNYLDDKFDDKNRMLVVLPMFHGFGLCVGVHASLCANMSVILQSRFNVKKTTRLISKYRVTTMLAVPRMITKLLSYDKFSGDSITSLQDVYVGGDSVSDALVGDFAKRMEECGGKGVLSPGYGLTETVTVCTLTKIGDFKEGSVGTPINGIDARIVGEGAEETPVGEVGELLIGGAQLMEGYLEDDKRTSGAFEIIDGKKYVRTGDLFKTDEQGRLYFLGRKKRLIKISGINVFPSEIESVARELNFVSECAAVEYRVGDKPYIRLLVEGEIAAPRKKEIIAHIARRMSHWNVPSEVVCVKEFPRTNMSKIDIKKLQEEFGR